MPVTFGAKEDRADDDVLKMQRHHHDRADVALLELRAHRLQRGIGDGVRNENRLAGVERPSQLRIPIDVHDQVADARVFVAGDEADLVLFTRQEDGAAIETEGVPDLARDGLQDVDEVQRDGDLLQQLDDGGEVIALSLDLSEPMPQLRDFVRRGLPADRVRGTRWRRRLALVDHSRMCAR